MKINFYYLLLGVFALASCQQVQKQEVSSRPENDEVKAGNPGALLVKEMIEASGGLDAYDMLVDVEFKYIYRDPEGLEDVSTERYIYDGELSWANYKIHNKSVFPDLDGEIVMAYDGESSWVTHEGELMTDPNAVGLADFMRKTNFYWFNMMFKLLDPGTKFEKKEDRVANGKSYHIVEVSFGEGVGDAQDIYLLYINSETKIVDQFLFTVMDFGRSEPLLMEVKYSEVNGLKWPAFRRYTPSNWDGELGEEAAWVEEISEEVKFNNGFERSMFTQP